MNDNPRTPHAERSQIVKQTLYFGELIRERPEDWFDMRVNDALGYVMKASGGQMNPDAAADRFRELVRSMGLEPRE